MGIAQYPLEIKMAPTNNNSLKLSQSELSPIALFVYNRLHHTQKTIEALKKNNLAGDSILYIFSDGPKDLQDKSPVRKVRHYIREIEGFNKIYIVESNNNLGLADSIINGVTEVVNQHGQAIILEDDLVTSPYFLHYMNQALKLYKNDEKVASIHGYVYPVAGNLPETFFLRGADCWGWATWKRGWNLFESDGVKLLSQIKERKLGRQFDLDGVYPYTKMLKDQVVGRNKSWAVRWHASAFLKNKLTLYPGRCLIQNIGTDNTGTHCKNVNYYYASLAQEPIRVGRIEIVENITARKAFQQYMKSIHRNQIKSRIKNIVDYFLELPLRRMAG